MMRTRTIVIPFGLVLLLTGCAHRGTVPAETAAGQPVLQAPTGYGTIPARVTTMNREHKFVVLDFSRRAMPELGTRMSVYRGEQRVGVVELTPPVRAHFATADIVEGEIQVGDEAR